jgi:hypothetical protein
MPRLAYVPENSHSIAMWCSASGPVTSMLPSGARDDDTTLGIENAVIESRPVGTQYFGRCEFAHSRACWIGMRGTAARTFCVAGKLSMRSRQRQNAGNFGYMACPSSVRLNANVLGSR